MEEIDREKLYVKERYFFVDVDVTIEVDESLETQEVKSVELYSLGKELKTINQEDHSDFVIRVDGREFKCHKNILSARSEYFKTMFSGNYIENREMDVRGEAFPAK